jgi:predicted metal-dependent phosphoesterase TrpH
MELRLRVEFHCHTLYSKDSLTRIRDLLDTCQRKRIDRIVVTDHNEIQGALRAQELDPERVIVGEEIMTQKGEILAAYVTERIPRGLPPLEVIARLRDQKAFISVSHPFDRQRSGAWNLPDLLEISPYVDAIEVYNSRCLSELPNQQAQAFAREHQLLGTVGSDAHTLKEIGQATMLLSGFDDPISLKAALAQSEVQTHLSGFWVHFYSSYARLSKRIWGKSNG